MENIYADILETLKKYDLVDMVTTYRNGNEIEKKLVTDLNVENPKLEEKDGVITFTEPFHKEERMIICGGGHVSLALAEFAAKIGFSVTVIDDREEFANKERFPWASEVICDSFENAIPKLNVNGMDYLVIVTRGHASDADCLRFFYKERRTQYVGMIGARKRVAAQKELLAAEGIDKAWLDSVHNPIGLTIGAVTPEEIAISILAEVIKVKRLDADGNKKEDSSSEVSMDVIEKLAFVHEKDKNVKKAVVTITESKGSAPRKAGAKMIVCENGTIFGTIGGGLVEGRMIKRALEVIKTGGYSTEYENMQNDVAANNGMVCGGEVKIMIEAV